MMAFPLNEPEGEAMARLASFALTVFLITMPPLATAQRAIPEHNLAYPVLLTIGSTTGSGFYLNAPDSVYLVTAKHVLFRSEEHTSELQSLRHLVCRLLLEKK